jgi:pilus assembly protein CpaB
VLATDQRTDNKVDDEGKTVVATFSTVTLEATPKLAEKIAVAQNIGQLSLSLRAIADNNAELERAIAAGEVTVPEGDDPKAEKKMLLAIASRPIDTDTTFTVGADVSRFQRRSVPAKPAISGPSGAMGPSQPVGPVIRVSRGNTITIVPVGGN